MSQCQLIAPTAQAQQRSATAAATPGRGRGRGRVASTPAEPSPAQRWRRDDTRRESNLPGSYGALYDTSEEEQIILVGGASFGEPPTAHLSRASEHPLMQLKSEVMVRAFLRCSSYCVGHAFKMSYLSYFGTFVLLT